ncbi:MAG: hypothetical protein WDW38_004644 [Sanguina aurantia]
MQQQVQAHTHRRASMVRLGAEKDLIDDFDWDAMIAEQMAQAGDDEEEEEGLKASVSAGSMAAVDTSPDLPRQPRAGRGGRRASGFAVASSASSQTMQRSVSRSETNFATSSPSLLPDIGAGPGRRGRHPAGAPACGHIRFAGVDASFSTMHPRTATPESSAPSQTATDPGVTGGPADSLLSRLRMSNFYEAPREHATDSKNSPKGKPFKNASAQGLPSKEQHFSGAKDETRAHGGAASPSGLLPSISHYPNTLPHTRRHSMIDIPVLQERDLGKVSSALHAPPPLLSPSLSTKTSSRRLMRLDDSKQSAGGVMEKLMAIFRR